VRRGVVLALFGFMLMPAIAHTAEWHEKIKLKGDVRFRNELIQQENKGDNFRWRIRARLVADAEINDTWSAAIGLASGSVDPASTNQTLMNGFSRKTLGLDLAYVDFHPTRFPGMSINAGKIRLPFETADRTQLVWDNDVTPEGMALKYKHKAGEKADVFVNAAGFYITDNDPDNEQWMAGGQAGFNSRPSAEMSLMAGASYYRFLRVKGMPGIFNPIKFYGNSNEKIGTADIAGETVDVFGYAADFRELEVFGVFDVKVNDRMALRFTGDYLNNTGADSLNAAYLVGGALNYGKDKGAVKLSANYRKLEADAVIGAFTYSDFIGGGTDGKGWELGFSYGLAKGMSFDMTYLLNSRGMRKGENELDYRRLEADFQARF